MSRRLGFWNVLCGFCLCATSFTQAEVVEFVIDQQTDVGTTGYELLAGKLRFEIDPRHPGNAVIADVELAPVVESGRVQFAADIRLFRPKDPAERTAAAWVEIPNRGGNARLSQHVISEGMTQVNIGWEFDVPAVAGRLRIEVPAARQPDGSPLRGVVSTTLISNERVTQLELTPLAEYRPIEIDGPDSRLIIRTAAAFPGGTEVPRSEWSLQDNQLHLKNGFEPGKTYEIFYLAEDPPVAGLGYAAVRDAIAWLKHDPFHAGSIQHVCAFGSSQCGRFLRDFVYLGFNTDEQNRQVADGILSHVAGAGRLVLNERWSTPRAVAGYYTSSYPFADAALPDPVSGLQEGIMENPRVKHPPKIFYINMAAEYWGAGRVAALTHTTPDGQTDVPLPDNVRSYFFAGTSHGPSRFPPESLVPGSPLANPVNSSACTQFLRHALYEWVAKDIAPPDSVYPQLSAGTLVPVEQVQFPELPGMRSPRGTQAGGRVANPQWPGGAGAGTPLPLLVPQVDEDGNDLGGIRLPDIAVPLGTATGWVHRPTELGSPHEIYLLRGAWIPFAKTEAERKTTGDPRRSLEERYPSKQAYLTQVEQVLQNLIQQRLLSPTHLAPQLQQASDRWDWVQKTSLPLSPQLPRSE